MLSLDQEIEASERLLAGVEARLHSLSEDLGASGADTRHVEQQSNALATKARNRREAYLLLRTYLQQITLTRDLVRTICEGSLEEDPRSFLKALKELEKKIEHARQPGMRQYKSTVRAQAAHVKDSGLSLFPRSPLLFVAISGSQRRKGAADCYDQRRHRAEPLEPPR